MWSAITLLELPQHPQPEMCDLLTLRAILSGDPDDEPTYPEWTYGGYLLESDWDDTDIVLRNVVARCLCDDPSRRPTMQELESLFEARRAMDEIRPGEFDEAKKWSLKFFGGEPPAATTPEPTPVPSGAGTEEVGWELPPPYNAHTNQRQAAVWRLPSPLRVYRDPQEPVGQRPLPVAPAPQPNYQYAAQPNYQYAPHQHAPQPNYQNAPKPNYQYAPQLNCQYAPQPNYQYAPQPNYPYAPIGQGQGPAVRDFALAPASVARYFAMRPVQAPAPLRNVAYAPASPVVRERGTSHLVPQPLRLPPRLNKQTPVPRPRRDALVDVTAERGNPIMRPNVAGGLRGRRPVVRSGAGRAAGSGAGRATGSGAGRAAGWERPASNRPSGPRAGEGGAGGAGDRRSASRVGAGRDDGRGEGPATPHARESRVREGGEGVQKSVRRNPTRAARPKRKDTPPKKSPKPVKSAKKGLARWVRGLVGGDKKERK